MESENAICRNIKSFRKGMDLTQDYLGNFLGVSREMIAHYEAGTRNVPLEHLEKLSDLFGVELYELMEEDPQEALLNANLAKISSSFRSGGVQPEDLEPIAGFKKIVKNYLSMLQLKEKNAAKFKD